MSALRVVDDVAQIAEIAFEHVQRAEPVQRLNGVIGVANPAIAIIPVALRTCVLGNGGRQGGDDRACLFVLAELEADGGADDGVLPVDRRRQAANPELPVHDGVSQHLFD